eukprot:jgi/Chlat1/8422/Chrsp80S07917
MAPARQSSALAAAAASATAAAGGGCGDSFLLDDGGGNLGGRVHHKRHRTSAAAMQVVRSEHPTDRKKTVNNMAMAQSMNTTVGKAPGRRSTQGALTAAAAAATSTTTSSMAVALPAISAATPTRGRRARAMASAAVDAVVKEEEEEEAVHTKPVITEVKPAKGKQRGKQAPTRRKLKYDAEAAVKEEVKEDDETETDEEAGDNADEVQPAKKQRKRKVKKPVNASDHGIVKGEEDAKKQRKRKVKKPAKASDYGIIKGEEEHGGFVSRAFRKLVPVPLTREMLERGNGVRLGYACLCMELRTLKPPVFCSRTITLANMREKGVEEAMIRAAQNVTDLRSMLEWNEKHGIRFFRLTSNLFPHLENPLAHEKYDMEFAREALRECGDYAKQHGHRLTFHPNHFNQLGAVSPPVLASTLADLRMHADIADAMGLGPDSILIVHGGGAYGDKKAALARIADTLERMDKRIRDRLAFENDERIYSTLDLLPLCERFGIPLCVDYFHHQCMGQEEFNIYDEELCERVVRTWTNRGLKPKCHFSEQSEGERVGAHSNSIVAFPPQLVELARKYSIDIMLECKNKETSVQEMHEKYFTLGVHPDSGRLEWVLN